MNRPLPRFALCLFLCGSLVALSGQEPAEPPAALATPHSRVKYAERDVVPVNAKIRYTTLIILPEDERILDFTCGDKAFKLLLRACGRRLGRVTAPEAVKLSGDERRRRPWRLRTRPAIGCGRLAGAAKGHSANAVPRRFPASFFRFPTPVQA